MQKWIGGGGRMQAEATIRFRDLKAEKIREPGEVFSVQKERFKELQEKGFAKSVEKTKDQERAGASGEQ